MRKHHPKNERIKRKYLAWLEDARQLDRSSSDQAAAAIALFEADGGESLLQMAGGPVRIQEPDRP